MLKLMLLAIGIMALAFLGFAIRILLVKDGKFSKRCSTAEATGEKGARCVCDTPENEDHENCKFYKEHHPAC